jgi:hypothetical protein
MTTRPTAQRRWPANAEASRKKAIDLAEGTLALLNDSRKKLYEQREKIAKHDHPMLTALDNAEAARDIADAMRYVESVIRVLTEARIGVE